MNPQGDDDVGDSISYVHDDETMDIDDVPPQVTFTPPIPPEQRTLSPPLAATRPAPRLNGHSNHHAHPYQPIVHYHNTPIRDTEVSTLRPEPSRETRPATRSPTQSPPPAFNPPTSGPSRLNPPERLPTSPAGSEGSSAGAFFRTYQSSSLDGRPDGALTPDLVFAEIGHGHGPVTWNGQEPEQSQTYQFVDPATLTVDDRPHYGTGARGNGNWRAAAQNANIGQGVHGANGVYPTGAPVNGTYRAGSSHPLSTHGMIANGVSSAGMMPVAVPGPPISREERNRGRPRTSRDAQESLQAVSTLPGQGQGRVPKRTFRSTLNSVEQHASSFLFGRPLQEGEGSGAGTTTRKEDSTRGY
jgi:hypothetical protein